MRKDGLKGQGRKNQTPAVTAVIFLSLLAIFLIGPIPADGGRHCGAQGDWRNAFIPDTWPPQETKRLAIEGIGGPLLAERIASEIEDLPLPYRFDVKALSAIQSRQLLEHIRRVGIRVYG